MQGTKYPELNKMYGNWFPTGKLITTYEHHKLGNLSNIPFETPVLVRLKQLNPYQGLQSRIVLARMISNGNGIYWRQQSIKNPVGTKEKPIGTDYEFGKIDLTDLVEAWSPVFGLIEEEYLMDIYMEFYQKDLGNV